MAVCKACSTNIVKDEVACDGICGGLFHAACLRRASRSPTTGLSTCADCADIKPCHVLRLVKGITASLSADMSLIADRIGVISSNWAGLQLFTDDLNGVNLKIDKLLAATDVLNGGSCSLLERSHELSSKFSSMSTSFDDLRMMIAGCDLPSFSSGAAAGPVFPIMDDIRRNIKLFKGDLGSWSAAVNRNSELINTIASDIKSLASRGAGGSNSPLPSAAAVSDNSELLSSVASVVGNLASRSVDVSAPSSPTAAQDLCSGSAASAPPAVSPPVRGSSRPRRRRGRQHGAPRKSSATSEQSNNMPSSQHGAFSHSSVRVFTSKPGGTNDTPGTQHLDTSHAVANDSPSELDAPSGSATLRPAQLPRCIFISRIHPDTTEDEIINHISSHVGAPSSVVACRKFNPSHGRSGCSFTASFRVLVPASLFQSVLSPEIWPSGSIVREFIPKGHSGSRASSKNLSAKSLSTTPT